MTGQSPWVLRADRGAGEVTVDETIPGWRHTGLLVREVAPGARLTERFADREGIVVPLRGGAAVEAGGERVVLAGRESVFAGPTDVAYLPPDTEWSVINEGERPVRIAVASAEVTGDGAPDRLARIAADEVPIEVRGAGRATRLVRNFGTPGVLDADSIIACEVITPAGNWSSWPPHKHDTERPGVETELEEIYYFELTGPAGTEPIGYQRVYGTDERPIDVLAEVRGGDVVLVPHGWHGPAMAPTGYDMYYLNVMAGPGAERAWLICDDPAHAWVRDDWAGQAPDPRLTGGRS